MPASRSAGELAKADLFQEKDHELIRLKEDEKELEVSLDTSNYRPDELKVSYVDGVLTVEGEHEEATEEGRHVALRLFTRKFAVPSSPECITSNLSSDGVLVVKARKCEPSGECCIKRV